MDVLKVPPHSIEAEQAVLGGLMIDNTAWDLVADLLVESDFYRQDHRLIFRAISELTGAGEPCDAVTLGERLGEEAGGLAYVGTLANQTPTAANVVSYARIVRQHAIRRQAIAAAAWITEAMFDRPHDPVEQLLDEAQARVMSLNEQKATRGPALIAATLRGFVEDLESRHDADGITGLASGYSDLDELTQGFQDGDLVILAGRPSMGKTTLAMNIAGRVCKEAGPVMVFSLEMAARQLTQRLVADMGRVGMSRLRNGKLHDDEWPRVSSAVAQLNELPLMVDDSAGISITELRSRARQAQRKLGQLRLVVVDYLQLLRGDRRSENRTQEVTDISRGLKALAKELSCPVIALSQLSREVERRTNKRPTMADLRESGAIEQDADLICFIYRDEVYNPESPDKGTAEIIVAKQRNGPIGDVRLSFLGEFNRFENLAPDWRREIPMPRARAFEYS
jgi:replicative DNA helicase